MLFRSVLDLLTPEHRKLGLFPAGRLDKDTEGLLILTNDGKLAHEITSPSKKVYKTYYVVVEGELDKTDAAAFAEGITLGDGTKCLPAALEMLTGGSPCEAVVRVSEGKYHQVKRMLASRGKPVLSLRRVAIGGLRLDGKLASGEYRLLAQDELERLFDAG